MKNSKQSEKSI